ncbi:MAG: hypothetical protein WB763_00895, partial [Terriglobia bacterium]
PGMTSESLPGIKPESVPTFIGISRSDAGPLPAGDVGRAPDAGAGQRTVGDLSREFGGGQGLWKR